MAAVIRPRIYSVIPLVMVLITVIGFSRTYYFRFLSDLPPLGVLTHLHGLVFTAWMALFVVQTRLVAAHRVDLHRRLGIAGGVLAALVVLVTLAAVAVKANVPGVHPSGLTPKQATAIGLASTGMFAGFLGLALAFRRRTALHKRFMVLSMIAVLTPPASRILTFLGLREYFVYLVPVLPALIIVWCLLYDWRRHRIVHPVYALGGMFICLMGPLRLMMGRADWFQPVAEAFARLAAS
jgi:hypothetical protein